MLEEENSPSFKNQSPVVTEQMPKKKHSEDYFDQNF